MLYAPCVTRNQSRPHTSTKSEALHTFAVRRIFRLIISVQYWPNFIPVNTLPEQVNVQVTFVSFEIAEQYTSILHSHESQKKQDEVKPECKVTDVLSLRETLM